jgi:hypothetical protein
MGGAHLCNVAKVEEVEGLTPQTSIAPQAKVRPECRKTSPLPAY